MRFRVMAMVVKVEASPRVKGVRTDFCLTEAGGSVMSEVRRLDDVEILIVADQFTDATAEARLLRLSRISFSISRA